MASWLYPISKESNSTFDLADGSKIRVTINSFKELVFNGRIKEDAWWHVSKNFEKIQVGDEVFIYTGNDDMGIIGYSVVGNKTVIENNGKKLKRIELVHDLNRSKQLIEKPVSAKIVREWFIPRNAVMDLSKWSDKLLKLLPWNVDAAFKTPLGHNHNETKLISSLDQLRQNIQRLESYRNSNDNEHLSWYKDLIKRGTCFVVYKSPSGIAFAPSRFVGYANNDKVKHDNNVDKNGRETNPVIQDLLKVKLELDPKVESIYKKYCDLNAITPNKTGTAGAPRRYWVQSDVSIDAIDVDEINDDLIEVINNANLTTTEKEAMIKARIGQGKFREGLISYWNGCAITKCKELSLLKASHIKPWRYSDNVERLDLFNGVLLTPNYDALFDKGYISFDDNGKIIITDSLDLNAMHALGIVGDMSISVNTNHAKYLKFHRKYIFKQNTSRKL